jgi:hypothetical protein
MQKTPDFSDLLGFDRLAIFPDLDLLVDSLLNKNVSLVENRKLLRKPKS